MSKLPKLIGAVNVQGIGKAEFRLRRQEDSQMGLRRDQPFAQVLVPDHKELDLGTLRHPSCSRNYGRGIVSMLG